MKLRALVVDDNASLADNVGELLSSLGVSVVLTHDVDGALSSAAEHPPDLAILDLWLPRGKSGLDLAAALRGLAPDVEIILVTGAASVESAAAAVRQGVFAYLQKPFDPEDLLAISGRALGQVRARIERQRLSDELARSEALHRGLVSAIDAAVLVLDASGTITFANAFAEALDEPGSSLIGSPFLERFVEPDRRKAAIRTLLGVRDGARVDGLELDVSTPGGRRTLRWSFRRLEGTATPSALAVGVDTTELHALQRRTVEAEALAAVGQLTSGLAHEIRNPLNAAGLQLELLLRAARRLPEENPRDRIVEGVGIVRAELSRLEQMLNEFLSLARPTRIKREPVDLGALVAEVATLQAPVAEARHITLLNEVREGAFLVSVDSARIKQVLINLLANAFDAMRSCPTGHVRISARDDASMVMVSVEDEGAGLDAVSSEDPFLPFVTSKEAGTGLGLAIVRGLVERHGGRTGLVPREPRGAVAWFTIPRVGR